MTTGLLPQGFHDRLPPHADAAAALEARVLATAHAHGYERVDPPLAEFEDSLASRLKSGSAQDAVRFVDPVSQRTLAIRTDITAQVGRIAATRMAHHPRPVRLSYAGPVMKLRAPQLHPERAMRQIGIELVGSDELAAAREVVSVAVEALQAAGVGGLSIDFTLPDLVDTLGNASLSPEKLAELRERLDAKDAAGVAAIAPGFLPLIEAAGSFDDAVTRLRDHGGETLASRLDGLEAIAEAIPGDVAKTLDPTELHGFEYQSWFGFTLFARGSRDQIGRGGSYTIVHGDGREEAAVGFSLYADAILDRGDIAATRRRLFLPLGTVPDAAARLRGQGWVTVAALSEDDTAEAQLCTHLLGESGPEPL